MPSKGEKGAAIVLSLQHGHYLLFMKSLMLRSAIRDFRWWLKDPVDDLETKLVYKELLRVEIIATTMHYAEVFAASLLAMRKYKRFHRFLLEYKTGEIIDFYKKIPERPTLYVLRLLQYPSLDQVGDPDMKKRLVKGNT